MILPIVDDTMTLEIDDRVVAIARFSVQQEPVHDSEIGGLDMREVERTAEKVHEALS